MAERGTSRTPAAGAALLLALILLVTAQAQAQAQPNAQAQSNDYQIGPRDLLEVRVIEIPDFNVERRVSDAGTIDLPMVGAFAVNGLTARAAADRLATLLMSKYVNRANVSIVIKQFANKPLSIVGAVAVPGSLNVSGRYTLLEAISAAGGLTQQAGKKIYVMRTASNGLTDVLEVRTEDLLRSSSAQWNIPVYPSDVVNVPPRSIVKVFCMGEVKNPGALEFDADDRISLLSVIAKAGGLTDRASKTIRIKRRAADGKDGEIVINYNAVVRGRTPDPALKADDVVIVSESFF